jgi:hypothetical protein
VLYREKPQLQAKVGKVEKSPDDEPARFSAVVPAIGKLRAIV